MTDRIVGRKIEFLRSIGIDIDSCSEHHTVDRSDHKLCEFDQCDSPEKSNPILCTIQPEDGVIEWIKYLVSKGLHNQLKDCMDENIMTKCLRLNDINLIKYLVEDVGMQTMFCIDETYRSKTVYGRAYLIAIRYCNLDIVDYIYQKSNEECKQLTEPSGLLDNLFKKTLYYRRDKNPCDVHNNTDCHNDTCIAIYYFKGTMKHGKLDTMIHFYTDILKDNTTYQISHIDILNMVQYNTIDVVKYFTKMADIMLTTRGIADIIARSYLNNDINVFLHIEKTFLDTASKYIYQKINFILNSLNYYCVYLAGHGKYASYDVVEYMCANRLIDPKMFGNKYEQMPINRVIIWTRKMQNNPEFRPTTEEEQLMIDYLKEHKISEFYNYDIFSRTSYNMIKQMIQLNVRFPAIINNNKLPIFKKFRKNVMLTQQDDFKPFIRHNDLIYRTFIGMTLDDSPALRAIYKNDVIDIVFPVVQITPIVLNFYLSMSFMENLLSMLESFNFGQLVQLAHILDMYPLISFNIKWLEMFMYKKFDELYENMFYLEHLCDTYEMKDLLYKMHCDVLILV
jgi:hypothetical protein